MRFTWWTYWVAVYEAEKAESLEFSQHATGFCGPNRYLSRWEFTELLKKRKWRERGKIVWSWKFPGH